LAFAEISHRTPVRKKFSIPGDRSPQSIIGVTCRHHERVFALAHTAADYGVEQPSIEHLGAKTAAGRQRSARDAPTTSTRRRRRQTGKLADGRAFMLGLSAIHMNTTLDTAGGLNGSVAPEPNFVPYQVKPGR
jgi:hypothetical protein